MDTINIISFLPLILALVLFFMKVPIGISLISASMCYFLFINTSSQPYLALQNMVSSLESFPLLAIPFFMLAGVVMNYSGISTRLMDFANILVGHMPGSLGQVNVLLSTLMGGISGSSNADAAMECKILVPQMVRHGYKAEFSAAVTACSSLIPSIIPPGMMLIIYCMVSGTSIGKLFTAGYIPGIMLCLAMMVVVHIIAKRDGYGATRAKRATVKEAFHGAKAAFLALLMPFGLILGMRIGMFTATEGGAMCVLYCLIVGVFVYKEIKPRHLIPIFREFFYATADVMFIIIGANLFGYYLTWERIPHMVSGMLLGITDNKYLFLLFINLFLIVLGMFIDSGPAIIILVPLLIEPLKAMGIDLIHFGLIMVLNLQAGGLTPPFGTMMFITSSMTKVPIPKLVRASLPFYLAILAVLMICTYWPDLVMLLPNLVYG